MEDRRRDVATEPGSRRLVEIADRVASIRTARVAIPAGAGITILVVLGILQRTVYPQWGAANLDSEESVATVFAAALLWAATICWGLVAALDRPRRMGTVGWSALLGVVALDEANAFHETLERRSGIDWQNIYLPILALGAAMW